MGTMIVIRPDGSTEEHESKKLDLPSIRKLIGNGCSVVERTKVRYAGKVRDCWLDEEGWTKPNLRNPFVKAMAEEYWNKQCQEFAGIGVVWVP